MFSYYLSLAIRSLRQNVVLTSLMVLAIGVGIGASMTMLTIFRAASGNPIPEKSAQLFVPQIDNFGPQPGAPPQARDQLPPDLTYTDAQALMQAHLATHQAAMYPTTVSITPPDARQIPLQGNARATYSDFFTMFDVPFQFGTPWGKAEDDGHAAVVVLTRAFNQQLFKGADSVGRSLLINNRPYRVIGVLNNWQPRPRFYDLGQQNFSGADQLFLPFTRAIDAQMMTSANFNCDRPGPGSGWDGMLRSNCIWIKFWLELPDAQALARYRTFLSNYAAEQRTLGRFHMMDDHGLNTLGLRLVAGRNFHPTDVVNRHGLSDHAGGTLPGIIITRAAAQRLSASGSVLGRTVLIVPDGISTTIIGIVDQLMSTPLAGNAPFSQYSMILPYRWADAQIFYVVRARPGQLRAAMTAARSKLYGVSTQRIVTGMQSLSKSRLDAYRGDRGLAFIMEVVCAILLVVTAFGIVGLTSYWVAQRRRQIGIRRALGATRGAILRHFQSENLLIAGVGVVLGMLLAIVANLWVVRSVALSRLPLVYPLIGVAAMLLLGQLAVLWPALRASAVPPASAARSA